MKHRFLLLFNFYLLVHSTSSFSADETYRFELPSKVSITIVEAPYKEMPASACPSLNVDRNASDYQPKSYVKSMLAQFQGQTVRFDVTCMIDAWNGRPLQNKGQMRSFGGWCEIKDRKPYCAFRGIFSDGSESYVAEWFANGSVAKRTAFTSSSDVIDLFMKNIDPPRY